MAQRDRPALFVEEAKISYRHTTTIDAFNHNIRRILVSPVYLSKP